MSDTGTTATRLTGGLPRGVVILVGLVIGMIVSLQTGIELGKLGQQDQIGTIVAVSMAREMGPFITATILTATVGSAIAAELGTMSVSNELDALEVMSVQSLPYLVSTRIAAGLAAVVPLYAIALFTGYAATKFVSVFLSDQSPGTYDHYFRLFLQPGDIAIGAVVVMGPNHQPVRITHRRLPLGAFTHQKLGCRGDLIGEARQADCQWATFKIGLTAQIHQCR